MREESARIATSESPVEYKALSPDTVGLDYSKRSL
jgi:hypothetical protein